MSEAVKQDRFVNPKIFEASLEDIVGKVARNVPKYIAIAATVALLWAVALTPMCFASEYLCCGELIATPVLEEIASYTCYVGTIYLGYMAHKMSKALLATFAPELVTVIRTV